MADRGSRYWVLAIVVVLLLGEAGGGTGDPDTRKPSSRIVVFLKEQCHHRRVFDDEDHRQLEKAVVESVKNNGRHKDVDVVFLPKTGTVLDMIN